MDYIQRANGSTGRASPLDLVLSKLPEAQRMPGGYFKASCPVPGHGKGRGDRNQSLSIQEMAEGDVRLKCFAGCTTEQIVEALGVKKDDLLPRCNGHRKIVETYDYLDEAGEMLHQTVRYDPKSFKQRRPDGSGNWIWNLKGIRRVIYRLPEVVEAVKEGRTVQAVEGEKDVHVAESLGLTVTTNPMGAEKRQDSYSEHLRGATVEIIPHNDDAGERHALQVANSLSGKAASVKIVRLPDAEDLHEWVHKGGTAEEYAALPRENPEKPKSENLLPFVTARELSMETPAEVPWRARPWVADGAITEIDGRVKWSGKTTWTLHMCAAILDGKPFMGEPTEKSGVVFLTEQGGTSFVEALDDAKLLDREDFVILRYGDVLGVPWAEVANRAAAKALELGYKVLMVDTLGQFAGLKGDAENNAGAALEAMRPLQAAAAQGLAVVFTRHDRKSGGEVGQSGRGSSAYSGTVDLIISLRRGEGNVRESIRKLETLGRFKETLSILMIDKTDLGYVSLGTETAVEKTGARERILKAAPVSEDEAKPKDWILEQAQVKYHTGHTVLIELLNNGEILRKGKGVKGDPHRFWRPDPGGDDRPFPGNNEQKENESEIHAVGLINKEFQQKQNESEIHAVDTTYPTDRMNLEDSRIHSIETNRLYTTERKSLTIAEAAEELRRPRSEPAKMLAVYLKSPNAQNLHHLACAVGVARNLPANEDEWIPLFQAVKQAANDPKNHPWNCECEECI